jgi:hypothetical protein
MADSEHPSRAFNWPTGSLPKNFKHLRGVRVPDAAQTAVGWAENHAAEKQARAQAWTLAEATARAIAAEVRSRFSVLGQGAA